MTAYDLLKALIKRVRYVALIRGVDFRYCPEYRCTPDITAQSSAIGANKIHQFRYLWTLGLTSAVKGGDHRMEIAKEHEGKTSLLLLF